MEHRPSLPRDLVDIRLLAAVEVLSKTKHYSLAAKELGVSVSLLRRRISAVEKQLALRIFQTRVEPVELTESGQAFIDALRIFLGKLDKIKISKSRKAPTSPTA